MSLVGAGLWGPVGSRAGYSLGSRFWALCAWRQGPRARDRPSRPPRVAAPWSDAAPCLQELLAEWQLQRSPRSVCGRLRQVALLGLVWLLCLGTTLGCTVAVYSFSELLIKVQGPRGSPGAPGTSGHNPAACKWVPRAWHLLSQEVSHGPVPCPGSPGCPNPSWRPLPSGPHPFSPPWSVSHAPVYFLLFSRFLVSYLFFRHLWPTTPFLCGWNMRPGVDVSRGGGCYLPVLPQAFLCGTRPMVPLAIRGPDPARG